MNINKLTKLLQLTKSSNDHEALAAIRKANAQLEGSGLDWNGLFGRLLQQQRQVVFTFGGTAGTAHQPDINYWWQPNGL